VVAALLDGGARRDAIHPSPAGRVPARPVPALPRPRRGVVLATKLRVVLARTATPLEPVPPPERRTRTPPTLDTAAIFETLGVRGRLVSDVAQFGVATSGSRVTLGGAGPPGARQWPRHQSPKPLSATGCSPQGTSCSRRTRRVRGNRRSPRRGTHVTALHNHLVGEEPPPTSSTLGRRRAGSRSPKGCAQRWTRRAEQDPLAAARRACFVRDGDHETTMPRRARLRGGCSRRESAAAADRARPSPAIRLAV